MSCRFKYYSVQSNTMKRFQYIPKEKRKCEITNKAEIFTSTIMRSEFDKYCNISLIDDYQKLLNDGCIYLPNFFCKKDDMQTVIKLKEEIASQAPISWSKHLKYENPEFSQTFNEIVNGMAKYFSVKVLHTRLNYYHDGNDWKPFHHDSHAYGNKEENFTMGASFGCSRELVFLHEESGNKFSFPQNNGDVFAFNKIVNQKFMHSIPKIQSHVGERFSIIAWGKRLI